MVSAAVVSAAVVPTAKPARCVHPTTAKPARGMLRAVRSVVPVAAAGQALADSHANRSAQHHVLRTPRATVPSAVPSVAITRPPIVDDDDGRGHRRDVPSGHRNGRPTGAGSGGKLAGTDERVGGGGHVDALELVPVSVAAAAAQTAEDDAPRHYRPSEVISRPTAARLARGVTVTLVQV